VSLAHGLNATHCDEGMRRVVGGQFRLALFSARNSAEGFDISGMHISPPEKRQCFAKVLHQSALRVLIFRAPGGCGHKIIGVFGSPW